jgi:uncharacterized protein
VLTKTFLHIPGIGKTTEAALWRQGCADWDCLLEGLGTYSCGRADKQDVREHLERSKQCLEERIHQYFFYTLGMKEAWRAFPDFRDKVVYLDIETDGGMSGDSVTTIGLFDGKDYKVFVKGENLEDFRDAITHYGMIVTFFGGGFDIPMLQRRFKGHRFDQIHIDLCPALRRLGFKGGLKKIEKQLGIQRGEEVDGLNGYDAVILWRRYQYQHDTAALEKLIAYNREDVVNLEHLAEIAYDGLRNLTLAESELTTVVS